MRSIRSRWCSKLRKPRAMRRPSSMIPLMASVPLLLAPSVSKYARNAVLQLRSVLPSLAMSAIGHPDSFSISCSASRRPWAGVGWRKTSRKAWQHL